MKIQNYPLLHVFAICIVISCGKNDHTENPETSPLYGTWRIVSFSVSRCTNTSSNYTIPDCSSPGALCNDSIKFTRTSMTTYHLLFGAHSNLYTISSNAYHYPSDDGIPTTFIIVDTVLTLSYQTRARDGNCLIVSTYFRN